MESRISSIKEAQILVKHFAERNGWKNIPNIDEEAFNMVKENVIKKYATIDESKNSKESGD